VPLLLFREKMMKIKSIKSGFIPQKCKMQFLANNMSREICSVQNKEIIESFRGEKT